MPRVVAFPEPKKRFHGARWRIYWKWQKRQYSIATVYLERKKIFGVDADLRHISAALAMEKPVFPSTYANEKAVLEYMRDR